MTELLPSYLIGMIAVGLCNVLSRALYAINYHRAAAGIGAVTLLMYVVGSGVAVKFGVVGIARWYATVWLFVLVAQLAAISTRIGRHGWSGAGHSAVRIAAVIAAAGIAAAGTWHLWCVRMYEYGWLGLVGLVVTTIVAAGASGLAYALGARGAPVATLNT